MSDFVGQLAGLPRELLAGQGRGDRCLGVRFPRGGVPHEGGCSQGHPGVPRADHEGDVHGHEGGCARRRMKSKNGMSMRRRMRRRRERRSSWRKTNRRRRKPEQGTVESRARGGTGGEMSGQEEAFLE
eukprot:7697651-Pyramimonas_sp.AAC.1